jgi:hypothetical protein
LETTIAMLDRVLELPLDILEDASGGVELGTYDYQRIPAMMNTVTLNKLLFLSQSGRDSLISDIGFQCPVADFPLPIMVGNFQRSFDESDQGLDPLLTKNQDLLPLARDAQAYLKVFQLMDENSDRTTEYLLQSTTRCSADTNYEQCTGISRTLLAEYIFPDVPDLNDAKIVNGWIYLAAGYDGLFILDQQEFFAGRDPLIAHLPISSEFFAMNMVIQNNWLYISDGQGTLYTINITSPSNPQISSSVSRIYDGYLHNYAMDTYGLQIRGDDLYMSAGFDGVWVVDISDPTSPQIKDQIIIQGRLIQGATDDPLLIEDIDFLSSDLIVLTDPAFLVVIRLAPQGYSPILTAYKQFSATAYQTQIIGQNAFISGGENGLMKFDLSQVASEGVIPDSIDLNFTGLAFETDYSAPLLFLANKWNVQLVDPNTLEVTCPILQEANRVTVDQDKVYILGKGKISVYSWQIND